MKRIFVIAALAVTACLGAQAQKKNAPVKSDTLIVSTDPVMHCSGCENKIKKNIRFVSGVKDIQTSVPNQTVTIIYNGNKSTYADFVKAFKKIGFDIKKAPTSNHNS